MPRVAILCFEGSYLSSAAGFADVLKVANDHLRAAASPSAEPFELAFLSESGGPVEASGGLSIGTQRLGTNGAYDAVIIPAIAYPGYGPFARFLGERRETGT